VKQLETGAQFGELSLLREGETRTATIKCMETTKCELAYIDFSAWRKALQKIKAKYVN